MAQRLAMGQLRVQKVRHRNGSRSYTIFDSMSGLHPAAERYLASQAFELVPVDREVVTLDD